MSKLSLLILLTVLALLQTACSAQTAPLLTPTPLPVTTVQLSWIHSRPFLYKPPKKTVLETLCATC